MTKSYYKTTITTTVYIFLVDYELNYPIEGREGQGLIIVNENFKTSSKRTGATKDLQHLEAIYDKLRINFRGNSFYDLRGNDMLDKVELFASQLAFDTPAIFVSLSTHGAKGGEVLGSDDREVSIGKIIECFHNNETLLSIPKVFIIQACRGEDRETRYSDADAPTALQRQKSVRFATKISDTLIAYSTGEGYVSWRDTTNGSWFIKVLHDCIMDVRYSNLHFVEILTVCSNLIIKGCVAKEAERSLTETPSYYSTLRKFLRFNEVVKGEKEEKKVL